MIIRAEPLSKAAFLPFGDVIEIADRPSDLINKGNTEKFPGLARLVSMDEADMELSIYRSHPVTTPVSIEALECHPRGSQAFFPLHNRPFPVVVALPGKSPQAADIRAFLSNGSQGINLNPGVWHHYQISLESLSDYLVVDRKGSGNLREIELDPAVILHI